MEITLIGEAAAKYKLKAGEEKFEIGGNINKAYPDLTVSLSRATCAVGEKLLPLLSVSGVKEDAAVTYYYTQYKTIAGDSEYEGSEAIPKIDENTVIDKLDEEGNNTYYVYAKTAATKNYNEGISDIVELTVSNDVASGDDEQRRNQQLHLSRRRAEHGAGRRYRHTAKRRRPGRDICDHQQEHHLRPERQKRCPAPKRGYVTAFCWSKMPP